MKIKIYIAFLLFSLVGMKINAQNEIHVDTIPFCYFNGITKQAQNINEIQVTNNSSEDYLTWISLVPINNKSNNDLIYDFFKKRKGDFNWIEMMYDNLLNKQSTCIGYSFVKNIAVGKTFSYFISKSDTEFYAKIVQAENKGNLFSLLRRCLSYAKRILIIKKKEVEECLSIQIDERCFFNLSCIFLTGKK